MKNRYCNIEFKCINDNCDAVVDFSVSDIESNGTVACAHCQKSYTFHHEFVDKMRRFSRLIEAVQNAKDILGDTNVAITIKHHEIKIPYRLLLTRMNTLITLKMEDGEINFKFRVQPLNEDEIIK
jgi:transcription elongation factor Elf1